MTTTTWLLTWTCYGNWLPGDERGFVSRVRDRRPDEPSATTRREHDAPGTEYDAEMSGLWRSARDRLKGDPIRLNLDQARVLVDQFHETAEYRSWVIHAAAVMANHAHIVVEALSEVDPSDPLADFKAYGSRALNRRWGKSVSGTWWTESGSKRKKATAEAIEEAIEYVRTQPHALVICVQGQQSERGT
ncbi:MAG TPA: transposase [Fimbriiglobus sp.]|jgi:REP element-mobilizing transposase RayT|nr:transposase [Fimbriiglobus sp.]